MDYHSSLKKAGLAAASAIISIYSGIAMANADALKEFKEITLNDGCRVVYSINDQRTEQGPNISSVQCPGGFAIHSYNADGKVNRTCLSENMCLPLDNLENKTAKDKATIIDVQKTLEKRLAEIKKII